MSPVSSVQRVTDPITRIAIAGHGVEAWLTANHLVAALGGKQIELVICPVPGSDALDVLYSIIPIDPVDGLASIKLSSTVLARECRASFSLGVRINEKLRPYGKLGLDFLGLPFHHHYLRANAKQKLDSYFDWSPATSAMQREAFAPPLRRNAIGKLQHAMACHVDATGLVALLRERAERNGVRAANGTLADVARMGDSDRISHLLTHEGETLQADLFIDCSGSQAVLMKGVKNQTWLPAPGLTRQQIGVSRHGSETAPPPFHILDSHERGWRLDIPTPQFTHRVELSDGLPEHNSLEFTPGNFAKPWNENCLALGAAAATILPTRPVHFRFLAHSIKRMISLLPGSDCATLETAEYNHLTLCDLREIQDMATLLELARKNDFSEWLETDSLELHDSLKNRLDLFCKRGWIAPADSEFFLPSDWSAAFVQLGLWPRQYDPLADRIPMHILLTYLKKLKTQIEKTAAEFPLHRQYLDAVVSAAREAKPCSAIQKAE